MKILILISSVVAAGAAQAYEALEPHQHPHSVSMLPGLETIGVAVLLLVVTVIAFAPFKRG
jgi:hypothetical protein